MQEKTPLRREIIADGLKHVVTAFVVLGSIAAGVFLSRLLTKAAQNQLEKCYMSYPMSQGWLWRNNIIGERV